VSHVIKRVYCTISLLNRFKRSTSCDLRIYLIRSLIIPIFLYSDIIYFPSLFDVAFYRIQVAFNACARYIFDLRRFDHLNGLDRVILGCKAPSYLGSILRFGPSARHRFFTTPSPTPSTALRNNSTLYRGIRLWNSLPSTVRTFRSRNLTAFKAVR
jgi:hypothetical protein